MKTYNIGNFRSLKLGKNNDKLCIKEKGSEKLAVFTPSRWLSFLLCLDEIDKQLYDLTQGKDIAYRNHYGGRWHVSVTKGFSCVDLRKFYIPIDETAYKPTKTGIALRLTEWPAFKQAVECLHRDNPVVANFLPCFLNQDQTTQQGIAACKECNPFPSIIV